jgi:hypothetical protein
LLGQNILIAGLTEVGWWSQQYGWNEDKIWKFFSKVRGRITSRMMGNYYGRCVIDSSVSSMESKITEWCFTEAMTNS